MKTFHSFFPELAQREVRCVHVGPPTEPFSGPEPGFPADEYLYLESYCEEIGCDCRRVLLQVIRRTRPDKVLASIVYGWEKESFYRKRMTLEEEVDGAARRVLRGELDPINEQSEFAEQLLDLFQSFVLDERYRFRLRRHYRLFKEELARRQAEPLKAEGAKTITNLIHKLPFL